MFERLLVAVESEDDATRVAESVKELCAGRPNCHVTLLHVVRPLPGPVRSELASLDVNLDAVMERHGRQVLERAKKLLEDAGIPVEIEVSVGQPGEEICLEARRDRYDAIVVGRRRLSRFGRTLHGDISAYVVKHSDRPVLVVQ
ncbi:MAG: universal stress protein [Clostridia bacterium]|nr:universal stress protein [Clostridia bacterium]